jgi:hypothetical protein
MRRVDASTQYAAKIQLAPSRSVVLSLVRFSSAGETLLAGPVTVQGVTHTAGAGLWVRAQVFGSAPSTIRARVWAAGQSEPVGWTSTGDSFAALQGPGAPALRTFISSASTAGTVRFNFDDYSVTSP